MGVDAGVAGTYGLAATLAGVADGVGMGLAATGIGVGADGGPTEAVSLRLVSDVRRLVFERWICSPVRKVFSSSRICAVTGTYAGYGSPTRPT